MFDWVRAVTANRERLLRIVAGLLATLDAAVGGMLTRRDRLAVLEELLAAESAARRLIVVAMRGIVVPPPARRAPPSGPIPPRAEGSAERVPAFGLFDPRTNPKPPDQPKAKGHGPRVSVPGLDDDPRPPPPRRPLPDDMESAERIARRVAALRAALADVPRQARRLARILAGGRSKWPRPMRPGRPPGFRKRGKREVDVVLADLHTFALWAMHDPKPP